MLGNEKVNLIMLSFLPDFTRSFIAILIKTTIDLFEGKN